MSRRDRRDRSRSFEADVIQPSVSRSRPRDGRLDGRIARTTFGVARANRLLADTLPDIIEPPKDDRPKLSGLDQPERQSVAVSAARKPPRPLPDVAPRKQATLRDAPIKRCKPRPSDSRKGGGSGKSFVPWCK